MFLSFLSLQAGIQDAKSFPMLVLANKVDIEDRKVSSKEAREWCNAQGLEYLEVAQNCCFSPLSDVFVFFFVPCAQTSAKDALNVSKAFESLAERVIAQLPEEEMSYETVDLSQKPVAKKEEGCAC